MSDREELINARITWSKTWLIVKYQIIFHEKLKYPVYSNNLSDILPAIGSNDIGQ